MTGSPNVVLIVMDTARADFVDTEVNGNKVTPFLSELRSQGGEFTQAYSGSPWTLPSHASLFTGTYPSKHGAHADNKYLRDDIKTLQGTLSEHGFTTFGISNNIWVSNTFGFEDGFDTFIRNWQVLQFDHDVGGVGLTTQGRNKWFAVAKSLLRGNPVANMLNAAYTKYRYSKWSNDDGAARTNKRAKKLLSNHKEGDPFFLFINYLEPHLEYQPPKRFAEQFLPSEISYSEAMEIEQNAWKYVTQQSELSEDDFEVLRALYAAETAYLDSRIADLVDMVRERDEETMFIVLGDHGENIGDHGLMDHQYSLYDTLLHVPLIVDGGPFSNYGSEDQLVQITDIVPTILDALDIEESSLQRQSQGESVLASDFNREVAFAEYLSPLPSREAIEARVGDPNNIIKDYLRSLRSIRRDGYKLIIGSDGQKELYDTTKDPNETTNIADTHPERVSDMESELQDWLDSFEKSVSDDPDEVSDTVEDTLEQLGYLQ